MTSPINVDLAVEQVATNFTNLFSVLRASIVQQLFSIFYGLEDYRNPKDFLDLALPIVQAGQETSSSATSTYLQMQMDVMGNNDVVTPPDFSLVTGAPLRNGTPPEKVYLRPFKEIWTSLARGNNFDQALESGANRLRQLAETDIQLAHTHTARDFISRSKFIEGSRRVPQGAFTCALCLIASTQFYRKKDLMPIHPGCDCRVVPATKERNTSHVVDKELLDKIHSAVAKQFGVSDRAARSMDYRKITIVQEHGEYGPTLAIAKYNFTGPSDLSMKSGRIKELALG
jgi:hypothetical protein